MKSSSSHVFCLLGALAGGAAACTADVHDNVINVEDPKLDVQADVDVDAIVVDEPIPVRIHVENVFLVAPDQEPPAEHVDDAAHFQIYLDDVDSDPLLVTAQTSVTVKVPVGTAPGAHKLICRLHKHDGTPTSATFELSIQVKVAVTVTTPDAGAAPDTMPDRDS